VRLLTTIVAVICASLAHAAHLAPWNPDGDGARVGLSANGGGVVACRVSSSGVESFSCDLAGNLLSASNSVAAETFAYDGTWNLASELMASNPNFRNAGVQNAVYQAVVDEWGSPLKRLGAYDNAPFVMESEIVDAVWDLGAAATAYRNLGVRQEMKPIPAREMPNLPDSGTTVLYHGGRLDNGTVQSRSFSTTTDYLYAREYARLRGGQVFQYNVPNSFINENALRRIDNIVESPFAGEEYRFVGPNVRELNRFLQK